MANPTRTVFYVSDSTGITAETFGHSLLSQFEHIEFRIVHLRYIDTPLRATEACQRIAKEVQADKLRPLVFSTLVAPELRQQMAQSGGVWFDLFETYIGPLQQELHQLPSQAAGRTHGVVDDADYVARIDAVNYALRNDDGISTRHYHQADVVLIGVSRTGKTPTCLYLALHYGVCAANYPLTEDEHLQTGIPPELKDVSGKLFGLSIGAERLQRIRAQRQPDSRYASLAQCRGELRHAEELFRLNHIPYLDITTMSVEEIATSIMHRRGMQTDEIPGA